MSCHRENVVWQSPDGSWSVGFFDHWDINTGDEDWDPEWDVEYDFDRFHWVSTGHVTAEDACGAWGRAGNPNPGGHTMAGPGDVEHLEELARACRANA